MGNKPKVEIYLRIRLENGKQPYYKAVRESKSSLKPFTCLVAGVPQFFPRGTYHLRYSFNGRQMWESVGNDPRTAVDARKNRLWQLANPNAKINDSLIEKSEAVPVKRGAPNLRVDDEVKTYLSNVEKLASKTHASYRLTLDLFQQSCSKIFVHQITKQDLQAFDSFLLTRDDEDRTRHNRLTHIVTFLRNREGRRGGPPITDVSIRVKYVEAPPEPYTRQELEDLFHISTDDDKQLWRFFLGTGRFVPRQRTL